MVILHEKMRIGSKGQVVIPKIFRQHFNLTPGDEIVFEETSKGVLIGKPVQDISAFARKAAQEIRHKGKIDLNKEYEEQVGRRLRRAGL